VKRQNREPRRKIIRTSLIVLMLIISAVAAASYTRRWVYRTSPVAFELTREVETRWVVLSNGVIAIGRSAQYGYEPMNDSRYEVKFVLPLEQLEPWLGRGPHAPLYFPSVLPWKSLRWSATDQFHRIMRPGIGAVPYYSEVGVSIPIWPALVGSLVWAWRLWIRSRPLQGHGFEVIKTPQTQTTNRNEL
jgi:hypothetical protein